MHMARDHHRRLIALDPLRQFDVAEKALAAQFGLFVLIASRVNRRSSCPSPFKAAGSRWRGSVPHNDHPQNCVIGFWRRYVR
jgi:hypothetical protein